MKKLMLALDALKVESFATGAGRNPDGTVRGHAYWYETEQADAQRPPAVTDGTCPAGCSDGCTSYSCASGGPVCCA
jgi:hypothetical protein